MALFSVRTKFTSCLKNAPLDDQYSSFRGTYFPWHLCIYVEQCGQEEKRIVCVGTNVSAVCAKGVLEGMKKVKKVRKVSKARALPGDWTHTVLHTQHMV